MARSLHALLAAQAKARVRRMERAGKALLKLVAPAKAAKPAKATKTVKAARPAQKAASRPATGQEASGARAGTAARPAQAFLSGLGSRANDGAGTWRNFLYTPPRGASSESGQLSYAVYLPPGLPAAGKATPVVVLLHGCQQDMHAIARGTRMNMLADAKGFAVVYVQQSARNNSSGCWRWFASQGEDEADSIAGIVNTAVTHYGLDRSRVYLAGMSAGAGMAALVALRHPLLVSAVAMHSGAVVGAARSSRGGLLVMRRGTARPPSELLRAFADQVAAAGGMPAIILHGNGDKVVAPRNAAQLAAQFLYLNRLSPSTGRTTVIAQGTRNEYSRTDYGTDKATIVQVCLVNDLGHAWSGGNGDIRFHASTGPDASALMWRFFSAHGRRARTSPSDRV